jgi:riboflavin kinase/FMN adenylyltransferase
MKHIYHVSEAKLNRNSIVTVGMFDGMHRGHQYLIQHLVEKAHSNDRDAVVLTFFPHPDKVIRNIEERYYLTTPEYRAYLIGELGVDWVITHPFDESVRQIRAADFVDMLHKHLRMSALWATASFAMGYKREGNIEFLTAQGLEKGFTVETIDYLLANGGDAHRISSSEIRQTLTEGDVEQATYYLGRPYTVAGEVVSGEMRGRQIGFPTANIDVWQEQILPRHGVYACWATLGTERFMAVTNIGHRPTFGGEDATVEAHLLDFDRDIYGQHLVVEFVARLRDEMKFAGIDALVEQIDRDVARGREILQQTL